MNALLKNFLTKTLLKDLDPQISREKCGSICILNGTNEQFVPAFEVKKLLFLSNTKMHLI